MATTTDVATTKKAAVAKTSTAVSNLVLGSADDALTVAHELQKFVKENKLTSTIQGKEFPNVEAWQFAGSLLGLSPMLESIEDKSTANEIKWNATVALQNVKTGTIVGRGFATCSNKESAKKFFADYAICSMAQTRAVGKAYRLSLGWLMKAAGYEATPLEEMQDVGTSATEVKDTTPPQAPAAPQPSGKLPDSSFDNQVASTTSAPREPLEGVDPLAANQPPIQYATAAQKEEIIRLLNNPLITRQEKTKMLLNINRLDEERATQAIAKLNAAIEDRGGSTAIAE